MGFESWEGEYTAVQLINNNGLTRVLTGCFLCVHQRCDLAAIARWKSCSSQKDAVNRDQLLSRCRCSLCPVLNARYLSVTLNQDVPALGVEERGCKMQMLVFAA